MSTIVVAGAVAAKQGNGGEAWVRMSWVRAFELLGFQVYFVEQIAPEALVDHAGRPATLPDSANLDYFTCVMEMLGLSGRSGLLSAGRSGWGVSASDLEEVASHAEMLVNISGNLSARRLLGRFRRRVYLDIDPGFTQFWHRAGLLGSRLADHNFHFSIGENIGSAGCPIPTGGFRWLPTRQAVTLDDWPVARPPGCTRLTTVGSLRGPYGRVDHPGGSFGLKIHEMRKFAGLPARVEPALELAFKIEEGDRADRRLLEESGWKLVDPARVASDPLGFRSYVQGSDGELSVAQGIYVETGSGWFSDRTARYLASSKPAIVQDTRSRLPSGEGLLTFRDTDEAAKAVAEVSSDYARHSRAARRIAEEYLDAGRVAGKLAEQVGVAP